MRAWLLPSVTAAALLSATGMAETLEVPQPVPGRPRLTRRSKADAVSVDGGGHVEHVQQVPFGAADPAPELHDSGPSAGNADSTPSSQMHPLSDAALLKALFPADDLPPEAREDFHSVLYGDPELAHNMVQGIRDMLFRKFHNNDKLELEHEFDDFDDEQFDDEELDDEGQLVEEDEDGPEVGSDGTDVTFAGLDKAHAEALQQEMTNLKVIELERIERQDKRGNTTEELQLENRIIDMMKPKAPSPQPAALTATGEQEDDQSVSINSQLAGSIMTSFVHSLDAIPEPIDKYAKLGIVPTEQDIVAFEKEVMGKQVKDQEELGANKETKAPAPAFLMGELGTAKRALLSRRGSARDGADGNAAGVGATIWPKIGSSHTVKYCRSSGLTDQAWSEFKKAHNSLHEHCETLNFVESLSDCQLSVTGDSDGCWASIGYSSSYNKVNLKDGSWFTDTFDGTCATRGIAEHELLHSLGMYHEHARTDRDGKVSVKISNVKGGQFEKSQFDKQSAASTQESYDYDSLMHYGCKAYAKDMFSDTLRANRRRSFWDGNFGRKDCKEMGQRSGLSGQDVNQLQRMYSCSNRRRTPTPPSSRGRRRRRSSPSRSRRRPRRGR